MSSYLRPQVSGARAFFTVALAHRGGSLLTDKVTALREAVAVTRAERPIEIDAWVVLPDHMHCIWSLPAGDADFSTRMGAIKARFTRAVTRRVGFHPTNGGEVVGWNPTLRSASKIAKGGGKVWQRRFWEHHIRDQADMGAHMRYCWWGPVKHGLVKRPEEWPYS
jgi:putative transposase